MVNSGKSITLNTQCKHILVPFLSYGHPHPHKFLTEIVIYRCDVCGFICIKHKPKGTVYIKPNDKVLTYKMPVNGESQKAA